MVLPQMERPYDSLALRRMISVKYFIKKVQKTAKVTRFSEIGLDFSKIGYFFQGMLDEIIIANKEMLLCNSSNMAAMT